MSPVLRRSAAASLAFHVLVGLALFVTLPRPTSPDVPEETAVTMQFDTVGAAVPRAEQPAPRRACTRSTSAVVGNRAPQIGEPFHCHQGRI